MIQLKIFIDPSVLPGEQLTACLSLVVDDASVIVEVATFQLLGFMASNSVKKYLIRRTLDSIGYSIDDSLCSVKGGGKLFDEEQFISKEDSILIYEMQQTVILVEAALEWNTEDNNHSINRKYIFFSNSNLNRHH